MLLKEMDCLEGWELYLTERDFSEGPEFGRISSMVGFRKGFLPFFVGVLVYY